ncbi:MAG: CAAX prenyl peptidase [Promethearchaeota archaeon CR_4]|nr:MAG: CAAX prenyl peptidase [Candidatus Lokiarchaeota archaeon CR_4]
MIHEAIRARWNERKATVVNSLAFSGIHILHHGLLLNEGGFQVLWVSGSIFFLLMMILSWILSECRKRTESIWPAVFLHLGFNLMMNITLFVFLL